MHPKPSPADIGAAAASIRTSARRLGFGQQRKAQRQARQIRRKLVRQCGNGYKTGYRPEILIVNVGSNVRFKFLMVAQYLRGIFGFGRLANG